MKETDKISQKWGFGMAPISDTMQKRYDLAVQSTLEVLEGIVPIEELELDILSELKGMFNRCVRQDQWDWFSVYSEFGRPPFKNMRLIAYEIRDLRLALKESNIKDCNKIIGTLIDYNILHYLKTYQEEIKFKSVDSKGGWIYILSTREQPNILKIGMTTRTVNQRIKEINAVTGIVYPYSTRKVIRVNDAKYVENLIHKVLEKYRIRKDREFFKIEFSDAIELIDLVISEEKLRTRHRGILIWFNQEKGYGFLDSKLDDNVFVHKSQIPKNEVEELIPSTELEYDLGRNLKGLIALNCRIISLTTHNRV